jgi:tRNA threonylcarbamoyl adenosine modification protein YeaZ
MRLLAIDTALEACSVAVVHGDAEPVLLTETIGKGHAERLMPMIGEAMERAGLGFAELDRIAVTVGPGSFTGVRVGIAAARGLSLVHGTPLVGIGTLAVHAAEARSLVGNLSVLAVIDARREELYGQPFSAAGIEREPARAAAARVLASSFEAGMVLAGSGSDLLAAALTSQYSIAHRRSAPDIGTLLKLGAVAHQSAEPPCPVYLRPPDAKPQTTVRIARR